MSIRTLALKIVALCLLTAPAGAVTKVATTVALEITTPLKVSYGEPVDGLAQVTAEDGSTVTGTVTFYDGFGGFCTLPLNNGASCPEGTEKNFSAGTHLFTAVYSGDSTHAAATSNAVSVTVKPDTTTTAVAVTANPVAVGGSVVYTATVTGFHGPVTGDVRFMDGAVSMGSTTLPDSGTASLSVLMLVAGDHAITAVYEGSGNSLGSTSTVLHESVSGTLAQTTTTLSASANAIVAGASLGFTAKIATQGAKSAPSGTVTFSEGSATLGSAMVTAGTATWNTSGLAEGNHSILARYTGDAVHAPSVSAPVTVVVAAQSQPEPPDGLTLGSTTVTVAAGDTVTVPVVMNLGSGMAKSVSLSCSGLPEEASCSYSPLSNAVAGSSTTSLRIATSAPRDCGSSTPYGVPSKRAGLPLGGAVLAGLLLVLTPTRRRSMKSLLALVGAVFVAGAISGCGVGTCTDLGTRPGTYVVTVTGNLGGTGVSQKVKLVVTP